MAAALGLPKRRLTILQKTDEPFISGGGGNGEKYDDHTRGLLKSMAGDTDNWHYHFSVLDGPVIEARQTEPFTEKRVHDPKFTLPECTAATCRKAQKPDTPNQDNFAIACVPGKFSLYGVFDGHGPEGHVISEIARSALFCSIISKLAEAATRGGMELDEEKRIMEESFVGTQTFIENSNENASNSGSTVTIAHHDLIKDTVCIAHAGDSRAVCWKEGKSEPEYDTVDHKPDLPEERKRIENSDPPGRVIFDGFYNHRVFSQKGMYPGLNMSRALGDVIAHKEAGLTAMPDVRQFRLTPGEDLMLMIASDGVWEFIENSEAIQKVEDSAKAGACKKDTCIALAKTSFDLWMADSEGEISDDITVILTKLKAKSPT